MKSCPRCERVLSLECFARNSRRKDGLSLYCRSCNKDRQKGRCDSCGAVCQGKKCMDCYKEQRREEAHTIGAPYGVDQVAQRWLLGVWG